jgi:diguanylate cyclase (GGDEF)-like protein/PAS domain S-box-containing protein
MQLMWQTLIGNLAVVGLILSVWAHFSAAANSSPHWREKLRLGVFLGLAASASMIMAFSFRPGTLVDLRSGLIALAGMEAGLPGLVAALSLSALTRWAIGGEGLALGIQSLALFAAVGLAVRYITAKRFRAMGKVLFLANSVSVVMGAHLWIIMHLEEADRLNVVIIPLLSLNAVSIMICGGIIFFVKARNLDRTILAAALAQSPNYLYVKNRDSRFVLVNERTASHNGYEKPSQMVGLSDFDLTSPVRAETLFHAEQELMRNRSAIVDEREEVAGKVFLTSKYPLYDQVGRVIGIAGTSQDVTQKERLEQELADSRTTLGDALEALHDGLAIYNDAGILRRCNHQYQAAFPITGSSRLPGEDIADLLDLCVKSGEIPDPDATQIKEWQNAIKRRPSGSNSVDLRLFNGMWLRLKVQWSRQGAVVLASDVTDSKQKEEVLRDAAQTYRQLAETDPLTGLLNRRAFDSRASVEFARHGRNKSPLSIMMVDIDLFKAFNDGHGHHEGDECLKKVANCLRDASKRPADIVARFGGEEFIVLLPDTDKIGAISVARDFTEILRRRDIPHMSSPHGHVTASIGIASLSSDEARCDKNALMRRADTALYAAKRNGRNRTEVWSDQSETMDTHSPESAPSFVI